MKAKENMGFLLKMCLNWKAMVTRGIPCYSLTIAWLMNCMEPTTENPFVFLPKKIQKLETTHTLTFRIKKISISIHKGTTRPIIKTTRVSNPFIECNYMCWCWTLTRLREWLPLQSEAWCFRVHNRLHWQS